MRNAITLLKRNVKLYFRDRSAVFFSLLSSAIIVLLYLMFIGKSYADGMTGDGVPLTKPQMSFLIYNLVFASVIVTNSISIPLCALTIMTRDFDGQKENGFLLTRIRPSQITLAYFLTGAVISCCMNIATWIIGTTAVGVATGNFLNFGTFLLGVCAAALISPLSSAIMTLIVALVKSTAAVNTLGGVSGTFFGFICGIYIPYANMGDGVKFFGSVFPFTHLTILFKRIVLNDVFAKFDISEDFRRAIYASFSAENVGFLGLDVPLWVILPISAVIAVGCLIPAIAILRGRIVKKK